MKNKVMNISDTFIADHLPVRRPFDHKGSFGRVLLLVGSEKYPGAALLASEAAMRSGVGYAVLCTEESVAETALARLPELICKKIPKEKNKDTLGAVLHELHSATGFVTGCGMSSSAEYAEMLFALLSHSGACTVIDADGLNSVAMTEGGTERLRASKRTVILTPHPLECARLLGCSADEVQNDRTGAARRLTELTGAITVLKGNGTVICAPDGRLWKNETGSTALSKAGSGDVLAGCIGSFCAQGIPAPFAAVMAVYLHGKAADTLSREFSEYGVIPSDLPRQIAREIEKIVRK